MKDRPMHILLLSTVFPPDIRSASQIMYELSETLVKHGYKVTVITAIPEGYESPKFKEHFYHTENKNGVEIIRVSTIPIHKIKAPAVIRGIGQILNALAYFVIGFRLKKVDVSIAYSPPLGLGITGYLLRKTRGIPHILNVQDLVPQYAIDLGILKNKLLIRFLKILEHFVYRGSQYITVHSSSNKEYIIGEGQNEEKVYVIPNWVDIDAIKPSEKQNNYRKEYQLEDKFVVIFAGILGFAQDLDTVVDSCLYLKEYKNIVILIVGEGVEKERLIKKTENLALDNIRFLPFVSKEKYPEVVAASDVCLATLQETLKCPVIPSKILGYMSAGRPVITALPLEGDAPKVIQDAKCGMCVPPGEPKKLADAIIEMYKDKAKCDQWGANGRKYIEDFHDREKCVSLYEEIFSLIT